LPPSNLIGDYGGCAPDYDCYERIDGRYVSVVPIDRGRLLGGTAAPPRDWRRVSHLQWSWGG